MTRRRVLTLLVALLGAARLAAAAAPATEVSGAAYAELDTRTGTWLLRGSPVVLTRGATRLEAAEVRYAERAGTVVATGGVLVRHDTLTLRAARVEGNLAREVLVAEGQVAVVAAPAAGTIRLSAGRLEAFLRERRLIATVSPQVQYREATLAAPRLEYAAADQTVTASGGAELQTSEGRLTAGRIRVHLEEDRAEAQPHVRVVSGDLVGEAALGILDRRAGLATLSGGAVVRRGGDTLTAATIVVDLRARRVVATGQPRIVVGAK